MATKTKAKDDTTHLPQTFEPRNPGMALDLDWVLGVHANRSAIERRAATLPGRRSVKKDHQAAWLCRAISCIDLTTLSGDDTEGRVRRLCAKARQPIAPDLLDALGMAPITTGAVCVYHEMIPAARIANGCYVIDVHTKAQQACHQARPLEPGFTASIAARSGGKSLAS